ncbi:formylglycine-generating enzyme family protein [Geitlerinema sp. P-1104]|nr:formylglycine-generating enzyme family protein [Geitlerinema sp. P-1104]
MGILWVCLRESRPVPVILVTASKNPLGAGSLVGESRRVIRSPHSDMTSLIPYRLRRRPRTARQYREDLGEGVILEMVQIPGGTFLMGAVEGEENASDDEFPQRSVTVPEFFLGKYQVTQAQWRAVATGLPKIEHDLAPDPSTFKGDTHPVERVNWHQAVEFCQRLTQATGRNYRLPSEAEWEYACRAGTTTPFSFGEIIATDVANYDGNFTYGQSPKGDYREQTTPVGSFPANGFGLYDMHGNVWEWCFDLWHENYEGAPTDGSPWVTGKEQRRLLRGGSWLNNPRYCRSADRDRNTPDDRNNVIGFRVCCSVARTP